MGSKTIKILVVDDDSANLTLINGILRAMYKVYAIDSGEDALSLLEMQRPDLILLDMEMPGMSGIAVFDAIQARPSLADIPVIFLTGVYDAVSEANAFKRGAVDFLRKPINDIVLLARVRMHLEMAMLRRFKKELSSL